MSGAVGILVSSSDRTKDVFERVFAAFEKRWPDCPWPRYAGFTSPGAAGEPHAFTRIGADGPSGWRGELATQVARLPPSVEYVMLFLDDFLLLRRVDTKRVEAIVRQAIASGNAYTRLRAPERSVPVSLWRGILRRLGGQELVELGRDEPYFSSLQIALWRRDHLLRSLEQSGSIWEFEHQVLPGARHYAVARSVIDYRHLVERGEWRAYAPRLLRRAGVAFEPGQRKVRARRDDAAHVWQRLKFGVIGYSGMRLGRAVRRIGSLAKPLVTNRPIE